MAPQKVAMKKDEVKSFRDRIDGMVKLRCIALSDAVGLMLL